tara:strand:- start:810 stop:1262 length:453 start_codon:yes stop_codon:yes gene_type:complete
MTDVNIRTKLQRIQSSLKAPKGQTNKFGGYSYRSCEDILTALKPLLKENECSIIITDDLVSMEGRVFVQATSALLDSATDQAIQVKGYAEHAETKKGMDQSQITGSASSYARKYSLNGLFAIDDTKDADATNDHGKASTKTNNTKTEDLF